LKKESLIIIVTKISIYLKQIQGQTKRSISSNWSFLFIIDFVMLLFASAIQLKVGWISEAEAIATCAYFALAAGVILQLICIGKNRFKTGVVFNGSG
jgi:hypothetical protein